MKSKRISMTFSGDDLQTVYIAVDLAVKTVKQHMTSCPDVVEYAEELEQLEQSVECFTSLLERMDKKLEST
jgi:hypothetical protein